MFTYFLNAHWMAIHVEHIIPLLLYFLIYVIPFKIFINIVRRVALIGVGQFIGKSFPAWLQHSHILAILILAHPVQRSCHTGYNIDLDTAV